MSFDKKKWQFVYDNSPRRKRDRHAYYLTNKSRWQQTSRRTHLRLKYKLTVADFEALLLAQGGRCAICSCVAKFVVDHDHESGKVRGLLCDPCNNGLGRFKESVSNLINAVRYLEGK